jgi:hypothetical protein
MKRTSLASVAWLLLWPLVATAAEPSQSKPIKVFILAGQSNMEGKGKLTLAESQARDPRFKDFYEHLRKDGHWIVRDDVWIKFLDRHGKLTVGYGSPNCIGPELEFGNVVGDYFDEPVLLIKTAWGGKSLGEDFLPPSSPRPSESELQAIVEKENANNRQHKRPEVTLNDVKSRYGKSYRDMLAEIDSTLKNLATLFPDYKGQGYELAGFVWFQGWNDHINPKFAAAYATNLEHFVRDERKDLNSPKLPFVIGQMGQSGFKPATGGMLTVNQAMASMEHVPDFRGTVKVVATAPFWDPDADKLIDHWQQHKAEWEQVGSDFGYHYLGSVRTFCRMGHAFGEAMLELLKPR